MSGLVDRRRLRKIDMREQAKGYRLWGEIQ